MKKILIKALIIWLVFLVSSCSVIAVDIICRETTGHGGKLVLDIEKTVDFH